MARVEKINPTDSIVRGVMRNALPTIKDPYFRTQAGVLIRRGLASYLQEHEVTISQLNSPGYLRHKETTTAFLRTHSEALVCSHCAIPSIGIVDPDVSLIQRRLSSQLETGDAKRNLSGLKLPLVMIVGTHVNLSNPYNGCKETRRKTIENGGSAETLKRDGGLTVYLKEAGKGYENIKKSLKQAGRSVETYSLIHIDDTGELIVGLKRAYDKKGPEMFENGKSLRENLDSLHKEKLIVMTGKLDAQLGEAIDSIGDVIGITRPTDFHNPYTLASTLIDIGTIARIITSSYEEKGYEGLIPEGLRSGNPDIDRTIAYLIIRNCVYRKWCGIKSGRIVKRKPVITRIGPDGAAHNRQYPAHTQVTGSGEITTGDLDAAIQLSEETPPLILVTGQFGGEPQKGFAGRPFERAVSKLADDADAIREELARRGKEEVVVVDLLFGPERKPLGPSGEFI